MIAARAYMRLKLPSEALQLFRDVEKLVNPETDMAFQAAYYRLLCFFQIEGRHLPDQVDAFLQLYRKARPEDSRIHTALMMKAETLFSNKETAAAAKVYSEINASLVSEKNRPGLLYQRGWCLSEAGDAQGAIRSLSEFIAKYPQDPRVSSAIAKRAKAYSESAEPAKAIADFDTPHHLRRHAGRSRLVRLAGVRPPAPRREQHPGHDPPLSGASEKRHGASATTSRRRRTTGSAGAW